MATLNDIKILLKNRVGFRKPLDGSFAALSADNEQTDSLLVFQDAHPMVTISNVRDSQPLVGIDDDTFNTYLTNLRESNVLSVLNDVFIGDSEIDEVLIGSDLSVFDKAIWLSMVLKVGDIILTSPRSNAETRLGKETLLKYRLDIQGSTDFKHVGVLQKYLDEIGILKARFNDNHTRMLNSVTLT